MKNFACYPTLLAVLFASCSGNQYKDLTHELNTSYSYDMKKIELTGYLNTGMFFTRVADDYADMELCTSDDDTRNRNIIINKLKVHFGKEPNSVYFPEKFERKEVAVYDKDGKKISLDDKVKLTGIVHYTDKKFSKKEAGGHNDYSYVVENLTITKI